MTSACAGYFLNNFLDSNAGFILVFIATNISYLQLSSRFAIISWIINIKMINIIGFIFKNIVNMLAYVLMFKRN